MSRRIFTLRSNQGLVPLNEEGYDSEDLLQALLESYPDLLAGDQMDEEDPRRWVLVDRECGIPNEEHGGNWWSLDHLFLDQDGIPTLVEVKRGDDPRVRREVVGQMFDYAANLVAFLPVEHLRARFENRYENLDAAAQEIAELQDNEDLDSDYDAFWAKVKTNLQAGKLRLLFVADMIPPELRRIVEFLNEQMDPTEVLAVEIKQYIGEEQKTLVPRVLGQTASSQGKKGTGTTTKRKWDEASFFQELQHRVPEAVGPAREILAWAKENMPDLYWGEGERSGSFFPGLTHEGTWHGVVALWTYGTAEMQFQHMVRRRPFSDDDLRRELLDKVNSIEGINLPEDKLRKRPSFQLATLADPANMIAFLGVLNWFAAKVRG